MIDATILLIQKIKKTGKSKKIVDELFMHVIRTFDHVSRAKLVEELFDLDIHDDLIR